MAAGSVTQQGRSFWATLSLYPEMAAPGGHGRAAPPAASHSRCTHLCHPPPLQMHQQTSPACDDNQVSSTSVTLRLWASQLVTDRPSTLLIPLAELLPCPCGQWGGQGCGTQFVSRSPSMRLTSLPICLH